MPKFFCGVWVTLVVFYMVWFFVTTVPNDFNRLPGIFQVAVAGWFLFMVVSAIVVFIWCTD